MKLNLTLKNIKELRLDSKPVGTDAKGKILTEPNPAGTPYIVFDATDGAPSGFGVKVAGKKTFIVQRKTNGKSFRATLGDVAEFLMDGGLEKARLKAAQMGAEMRSHGVNPNVAARSIAASELTLGQAFDNYLAYIKDRKDKPPSTDTVRNYKRYANHFQDWRDIKIKDLDLAAIVKRFALNAHHATSNEATFRYAFTVVAKEIEIEALAAAAANRAPLLAANPFSIIKIKGLYRTKKVVERERIDNFARNPMNQEKLGRFLEVLWSKRLSRENKTGCDYLLLTLVMGARKSECAKLKWAELLTEQERVVNSWVDLKARKVFFYKTKNGLDHSMPLGPCMTELLRRRQEESAQRLDKIKKESERIYVFPARSKFAANGGHYSDSTDLLGRIAELAEIPLLTRHDLRRTMGSIFNVIEVPDLVGKRFLNHLRSETHALYTESEWKLLASWMERIEEAILTKAPNVWNALKPIEKSPLAAPPPFVIPPDKARTGRPAKARKEAAMPA